MEQTEKTSWCQSVTGIVSKMARFYLPDTPMAPEKEC